MANEQVIERLRQGDWYVVCETVEKADLLLQACEKAGLKWNKIFKKATEFNPFKILSLKTGLKTGLKIGFCRRCRSNKGLTHTDSTAYDEFGLENITDWFFNAIKGETTISNDSKLIPQNEEQEHLVQMLLAKLQGIPVEYWSTAHDKWLDSKHDAITASAIYRIKSTFNPETSLTERPEGV